MKPPLPEFFESAHILVVPRFAAKYLPGHAAVLAPFLALGAPWLAPCLLLGLAAALIFLAARLAGLSRAGGLSKAAGSQVVLVRAESLRDAAGKSPDAGALRLNVARVLAGDPVENVAVGNGDTLVVPKGNTFFVFGEVKKPGAYQLEKDTNVLEGITLAGGFTDKAAPGRTRVIRSTPQGQTVIEVDMNDILRRGREAKGVMLQESDVVVVPESFF